MKILIFSSGNIPPIKILVEGLRQYGKGNFQIDALNLIYPDGKIRSSNKLNILDHEYCIPNSDTYNVHWDNFSSTFWNIVRKYYGYILFLLIRLRLSDLKKFIIRNLNIPNNEKDHQKLLLSYDIINLHYIQRYNAEKIINLPKSIRVVLSFWGSDLFTNDNEESVNVIKKAIKRADAITMHSEEMKKFFIQKYGGRYAHKVKLVLFGSSEIVCNELIHNLNYYKDIGFKLLQEQGVDNCKGKVLIKIGYSGHKAQQHIEIIHAIRQLPERLLNGILLIVPMTYGATKEYIQEIIDLLNDVIVDSVLINDYMSDEEALGLSAISDVLLNLRETDAFNGAMVETLLSGNILVSGAWLPYSRLRLSGANFFEINEIKDLPQKMEYIIANFDVIKFNNESNPIKVKKIVSSKYNSPKWEEILVNDQ